MPEPYLAKCVISLRKKAHLLLVLLLLWPPLPARPAAAELTVNADQQLALAEHYVSLGHYFRAISEYQRFLFYFPEDARRVEVRFRMGLASYQDRDYGQAAETFRDLVDREPAGEYVWRAWLMLSQSHAARNDSGAARLALQNLLLLCDDVRFRDEAHYRLGWLDLEQQAISEAQAHFGRIENFQTYAIQQLQTELQHLPDLSLKSPWGAGLLALLPGAGYVYCGRWQDALIAFTLNTTLLLATWESFDRGQTALGTLLGLTATSFYTASIYGSITAAHKSNAAAWKQELKRLRTTSRLQLSLQDAGGWQVGLMLVF